MSVIFGLILAFGLLFIGVRIAEKIYNDSKYGRYMDD